MPDSSPAPLYVATPRIHPRAIQGRYRTIKTSLALVLLVLTAVLPWVRWSRGDGMPDQAVLFSFTAMRAYCFDLELWPQDFYYLTALLVVAGLGLFLASTLWGRVWCGFACPQTMWTDLFVWVEKLCEGDRNQRLALEKQPYSLAKLTRKLIKHSVWLLISALTGAIFCFYFTDAVAGARDLLQGRASATLWGFWGGFTAMTYGMAGWLREQMCTYMCPWPRIPGGMLDAQTLVIDYDSQRGEPRAHAKAGGSFAGRGHCVDCSLCVQVCPVGIDIRQGSQMECLSCGLCIDACDQVMTHFTLPRNLIGWKALGGGTQVQWWRPRVLTYVGLMALVGVLAVMAFIHRPLVDMAVLPDRSPLSVMLADGTCQNTFTLRLSNKDHHSLQGAISIQGLDHAQFYLQGQTTPDVNLPADSVSTARLVVQQSPVWGQTGITPMRVLLAGGLAVPTPFVGCDRL